MVRRPARSLEFGIAASEVWKDRHMGARQVKLKFEDAWDISGSIFAAFFFDTNKQVWSHEPPYSIVWRFFFEFWNFGERTFYPVEIDWPIFMLFFCYNSSRSPFMYKVSFQNYSPRSKILTCSCIDGWVDNCRKTENRVWQTSIMIFFSFWTQCVLFWVLMMTRMSLRLVLFNMKDEGLIWDLNHYDTVYFLWRSVLWHELQKRNTR